MKLAKKLAILGALTVSTSLLVTACNSNDSAKDNKVRSSGSPSPAAPTASSKSLAAAQSADIKSGDYVYKLTVNSMSIASRGSDMVANSVVSIAQYNSDGTLVKEDTNLNVISKHNKGSQFKDNGIKIDLKQLGMKMTGSSLCNNEKCDIYGLNLNIYKNEDNKDVLVVSYELRFENSILSIQASVRNADGSISKSSNSNCEALKQAANKVGVGSIDKIDESINNILDAGNEDLCKKRLAEDAKKKEEEAKKAADAEKAKAEEARKAAEAQKAADLEKAKNAAPNPEATPSEGPGHR